MEARRQSSKGIIQHPPLVEILVAFRTASNTPSCGGMSMLRPTLSVARPTLRRLSRPFFVGTKCLSSVGTTDATADVGSLNLTKQVPRPIFPWRHEPAENLLPRLTDSNVVTPFPTPQEPFASLYLGVPLWDSMVVGKWKAELSDSMTYAFLQGVSGIISNTFRIPYDSGTGDSESVSIQYPYEGETPANDDPKLYCPQVDQMLSPPLRKLFQSAHASGRDQLRILLETRPVRSTFYRLYAVPFYTKEALEADPSILKTLFNGGKPEWGTVYESIYTRSMEQLELYDRVETTVAAEVYVICEERFQVVDAETGVVLQGPEGASLTREVGHLATFEMTSTNYQEEAFPYGIRTERGNWQLIDIDDLVSTQKWYHMP